MIPVLLVLLLSRDINFALAVPAQTLPDFNDVLAAINGSAPALSAQQELQCDSRYGENLDILDCRNAISQLKTGSERLNVVDRDDIAPGEEATIPLPYRLMGSKSASACVHILIQAHYQMTYFQTYRPRTLLSPACVDAGSLFRQSKP